MMRCVRLFVAVLAVSLVGCGRDDARTQLLGTLEWDRVELITEASEPILAIAVREGEAVTAGQTLVSLDPRRAEIELALARAEQARLTALREEQQHGARPEAIAESKARVAQAQSGERNARLELGRVRELRGRKLVAQAELDRATSAHQGAAAALAGAQSALDLVRAGTRSEQLAQTDALLAASAGRIAAAELTRERLNVRAPRAGRIDAIPVEVGDQPPRGATLVSVLVGEQPYARVYIPEPQRAALADGARFRVTVEGVPRPFPARLRFVKREPSFTPYYALTGDDASRLVYVAELELEGEAARKLPAGLPVQAEAIVGDAAATQ